MPDADVAVYRRAFDAFNRRDFAAWEAAGPLGLSYDP